MHDMTDPLNEFATEKTSMKSALELLQSSDADIWSDAGSELLSDPETLKAEIRQHFHQSLGREFSDTTANYLYSALAMTVRDRLMNCWRETRLSLIHI